jgi:sugar lactone lactonase YvrE
LPNRKGQNLIILTFLKTNSMKQLVTTILCLAFLGTSIFAQMSVLASDLVSPVGIEADAAGNQWVTDNGTSKNDGRIVLVKLNGDKIPIITGLPSAFNPAVQEPAGVWSTFMLPNNRLAVIVGETEALAANMGRIYIYDLTGFQPGVSTAKKFADTVSSIDIARFSLAQTGVTESNIFSAVWDNRDNSWYVADAAANMIVKVAPNGQKSVFARFPKIPNPTPIGPPVVDPVPTKIIINPDGGFYVGTLTGFPFNEGQAAVYNLDKNGNISVYCKGLSLIAGLTLDTRTGDLYAAQYARFAFAPTPGYVLGSGKLHRIPRGGAYSEVVASNYGPGAGVSIDKNGNLYATSLFTSQLMKIAAPTCGNFELGITADNPTLRLFNSNKYTLKVTNKGTTTQNNVRIYWLPPYKRFEGDAQPFAYQGSYASKGYYDGWHGYWTIESLAAGESATATFHLFVVNDRMDATQTAQVAGCNQRPASGLTPDPDNSVSLTTKANTKITEGAKNVQSQTINISPNPANNNINVLINTQTDNDWHIQVVNTLGQTVFKKQGHAKQLIHIDASNFQNGVYIVDYQSSGERKTQKIVVQH